MKRKICVITGSRAEYGLLYWLMKEISDDPDLELQVIVTGMHLSPEFGLTYQQIEADGFTICAKVEMLLSSDTPVGVAKSMGLGMIGFSDILNNGKPDLMVVLGDRFEIFSAVSAALIAGIPVAHLHGGESSQGAFDDSLRHAVTKMAHLHFPATEIYRERIIRMGESPERVFNFGCLGIDGIQRMRLMNRSEFEASIQLPLAKRNLLVTFHPVTLEKNTSQTQFEALLNALDTLVDTHIIFTYPNADTYGRVIIQLIDDYVKMHPDKSVCFQSLGQQRFLSALQYMDAIVGNSSAGLIEAPTFKIGTINIGDRQKGRIKAESVIDCAPTEDDILRAFNQLYSHDFQDLLKHVSNPYGSGGAAYRIKEKLKSYPLDNLLKKQFYDGQEKVA